MVIPGMRAGWRGKRGLDIQDVRTRNILSRLRVLPGGFFRQAPPLSNLFTRVRKRVQYTNKARRSPFFRLDLDPEESGPLASRRRMESQGFPPPLSEGVRFLGIILDPCMTMDERHRALVSKALVRQSVFARVAHTSWA